MKKDAGASSRGWDILAKFIQERAKRQGPDGDLTDDERFEELEEAADGARRLLKDPAYQRLRLQGMQQVVDDFMQWLDLDPAGHHFEMELHGIHQRASARFWELFQPEAVIKAATDARRKRDSGEEAERHGGRKSGKR